LNLYPNLSLYPRWPGLEEDDDLAGPADQAVSNGNTDANANADQASAAAQAKPKKEYTQEEYEAMNLKYLGRLKSQGYKVDEVMRAKRREKKDKAFDAKRRRLDAGQSELSKEEQELALEEEDEEAGNA
jgi:tRNA (guanine-N(7)-)-methyltransferase subunit TRM82